ncbi:aspartic peptidase domain-containing protein, partial [Dipodascopsis uninucleata]
GVLQLDFIGEKSASAKQSIYTLRHRDHLIKRATSKPVLEAIDNALYLYYANVSVGTPAQDLRLLIDTGSADVWFQTSENPFCETDTDPCAISGQFNYDESSTYDPIENVTFSIHYADKTYARGVYARDTFEIGGAVIDNYIMGVCFEGNSTQGIMGIGYNTDESIASSGTVYKNVPQRLVDSGYIKTPAYSLWLNDLESSTGNVLFGGIDTEKFSGELVQIAIDYNKGGRYSRSEFFVSLTGFSVTSNDTTTQITDDSFELSGLLDSGTSFTFLPNDIVEAFAEMTDSIYDEKHDGYITICNESSLPISLNYIFGDVTIPVSLNELFIPTGEVLDGDLPLCLMGIFDNSKVGHTILGQNFLRSAYVVYDMRNSVIAMAPTVFNSSKSNIVAI